MSAGVPERERGFCRAGLTQGGHVLLTSAISTFLLAFPALFSIVNPLGGALIYSQVTANRGRNERVALAWKVALSSACVMLGALWFGAPLLSFFGISLSALRIAGGLVVAVNAWELLAQPEQQEGRKQQQAAPAGAAADVAFFPLTIPFTTGPGTISVIIALSASGPAGGNELLGFMVGASAAALAMALCIGLCYASADRVTDLLGQAGSRVVTRLAAFLLLCIGVQILLTGVADAVTQIMAERG